MEGAQIFKRLGDNIQWTEIRRFHDGEQIRPDMPHAEGTDAQDELNQRPDSPVARMDRCCHAGKHTESNKSHDPRAQDPTPERNDLPPLWRSFILGRFFLNRVDFDARIQGWVPSAARAPGGMSPIVGRSAIRTTVAGRSPGSLRLFGFGCEGGG